MQTVTEYHGGAKCLTRARLRYQLVPTTVLINLFAITLLVYRQLHAGAPDLLLLSFYGAFLAFLAVRAYRLKIRVAELVDAAAQRAGLQHVS